MKDALQEFMVAIHALGGTIQPILVHDDPIEALVPEQHRERAQALMQQLHDNLRPAPRK